MEEKKELSLSAAEREHVKSLLPMVKEAQDTAITVLVDLSKWLIASLLITNSGALIAVLNSEHVSVDGKLLGGLAFACGLCAALLTGYANFRSGKKQLKSIRLQYSYMVGVLNGKERQPEVEEQIDNEVANTTSDDWIGDSLGFGSFFLLIIGLCAVGMNLVETTTVIDQAVQSEVHLDGKIPVSTRK